MDHQRRFEYALGASALSPIPDVCCLAAKDVQGLLCCALRLHGLGQLAQLDSENLCARSGHRPWFAGIPTASGGT